MPSGKGGPNFWFTEEDARVACDGVFAGVTFQVTVPPHQFVFIPGNRVVGGQWISEDCEFGNELIAHITMTISKLQLSPSKEAGEEKTAKSKETKADKLYHALLSVEGLHYTVRSKTDSDWIAANIKKVVADQDSKKQTADVLRYESIQRNSLHLGLKGDWNSGNKTNTAPAKLALGGPASIVQFPSNLDKVAGLISTVGAVAFQGKIFQYSSKNNSEKVKLHVNSAAITVK
jgi:hypothetical protein